MAIEHTGHDLAEAFHNRIIRLEEIKKKVAHMDDETLCSVIHLMPRDELLLVTGDGVVSTQAIVGFSRPIAFGSAKELCDRLDRGEVIKELMDPHTLSKVISETFDTASSTSYSLAWSISAARKTIYSTDLIPYLREELSKVDQSWIPREIMTATLLANPQDLDLVKSVLDEPNDEWLVYSFERLMQFTYAQSDKPEFVRMLGELDNSFWDEVIRILSKQSGLLWVSGASMVPRVLKSGILSPLAYAAYKIPFLRKIIAEDWFYLNAIKQAKSWFSGRVRDYPDDAMFIFSNMLLDHMLRHYRDHKGAKNYARNMVKKSFEREKTPDLMEFELSQLSKRRVDEILASIK